MFLRLFNCIESSLHESDFQSDPDEVLSLMSDTDTICDSQVDIVDNIAKFDENWRFLCVADVETGPVCRRFDKLIRNGISRKTRFFTNIWTTRCKYITIQNTHLTKT